AHFWQAALRLEIPSTPPKPRATRHRHQRGRYVRRANDRQAREDHFESRRQKACSLLRNPNRQKKKRTAKSQRPPRRRRNSSREEEAGRSDRKARHRMGRSAARHPSDDRATSEIRTRPRQRRRIPGTNGNRQPAHRAALQRPGRKYTRL